MTQSTALALCVQCPEIQKQIKKEFKKNDIELTKAQKKEIKYIKKEMKSTNKDYDKQIKSNQREINRILKKDCPDIVKMMELKNANAQIKKRKIISKKEFYGTLMDIYTPEQQYIAKT